MFYIEWSATLLVGPEVLESSEKVVHCYRKNLTCCLCGVGRDDSVCFQCYADGQTCEERRRVQHGEWCGVFWEMRQFFNDIYEVRRFTNPLEHRCTTSSLVC